MGGSRAPRVPGHTSPPVAAGAVAAVLLLAAVGCRPGGERLPAGAVPAALVAVGNASAPDEDVSGSSFCAGVLVAPARVLTARHCLRGRAAGGVNVWVGADNLCSTDAVAGFRQEVGRLSRLDGGDAALVQLVHPLTGEQVEPLPIGVEPAPGDLVAAWGWGAASPTGTKPCAARQTVLRVVERTACAGLAGPAEAEAYFCAVPALEANTCAGDSGGPVVDTAGRLVGIVSAGSGCGPHDPGTYWTASNGLNTAGVGPSLRERR